MTGWMLFLFVAAAGGVGAGLRYTIDGGWATAIGVGLLGGYTTFSTVSVETVLLGRGGRRDWAWINLIGTLVISGIAAAVGVGLGRLIAGWIAV